MGRNIHQGHVVLNIAFRLDEIMAIYFSLHNQEPGKYEDVLEQLFVCEALLLMQTWADVEPYLAHEFANTQHTKQFVDKALELANSFDKAMKLSNSRPEADLQILALRRAAGFAKTYYHWQQILDTAFDDNELSKLAEQKLDELE